MGLATTVARRELDGDASTLAFSFPYKYIASANLKVYLYDEDDGSNELQTLTTDYTVTPTSSATNGVYPGATITFTAAPGTDKKVVIFRDPALTQEFDFDAEADPLPVLTRAADNDAMRWQAIDSRMDRAVRIADGEVTSFDPTIPTTVDTDGGEALCLAGDGLSLIWGTGLGNATVSSKWSPIIAGATFAFDDTVTISPAAASDDQGLVVSQSGPSNGAALASGFAYNDVLVNGDQGNSPDTAYGFQSRMGAGGSSMKGQRTALRGFFVLNAASSNTTNPNKNYCGTSGEVQASHADGGSDTSSNAKGRFIGLYASSIAAAGATNLYDLTGLEINTGYRATSSGKDMIGLKIASWADHAVDPANMGAAIQISVQSGALPWKHYAIVIDQSSSGVGSAAVATGATLIATKGSVSCTHGIDFSTTTFSGSAFKSANFSVSNAGAIAATALTFSANAPVVIIDELDGGSDQRKWYFRPVASVLRIEAVDTAEGSPVTAISISRTGTAIGTITMGGDVDLASGKVRKVAGTQVLGPRNTGWSTFAGTGAKNASGINVDTFTATDANIRLLGGVVKGMLDALITHGAVGA